jgi:hypothetical protein
VAAENSAVLHPKRYCCRQRKPRCLGKEEFTDEVIEKLMMLVWIDQTCLGLRRLCPFVPGHSRLGRGVEFA